MAIFTVAWLARWQESIFQCSGKICRKWSLTHMVKYYHQRHDEQGLREELIAFGIVLRRAAMLPQADLEEVSMQLTNYDPFLMEDPHFGALLRDLSEARAAEVSAKALADLKHTLLQVVEARFPVLTTSLGNVVLSDERAELDHLMVQVATATDEQAVRQLLNLSGD